MNQKNHKIWDRFRPKSILSKVNLTVLVTGLLLIFFSGWLLYDSMNLVEYDLMRERLTTDIRYLRDELGENQGAEWSVRDGALYIGDRLIGDGSVEKAYEEPLLRCEANTGTFFYIFLRTDNDDELGYARDGGYQEGHYLRVCGTTRGPNGEKLEGTYIDRRMADGIEKSEDESYTAISNVKGRAIYCHYEYIKDKDGNAIGIISNGRSVEELQQLIKQQRNRGVILSVLIILLMLAGMGFLVYSMLKSIRKIRHRLEMIGSGDLPEDPLIIDSQDELSAVADSINDMVISLKEKERIHSELSVATDIQAHMLPSIYPAFPGHDEFDIYATMEPAKEVGGDFFDFFMLDEKQVAIVIADVSGKGVPAALFMVIAKTLIKNHALMGKSPEEVFTTVNQMLCEGNEVNMFVTAWMGILNLEDGKLTYVNAGHNPPVIMRDGQFDYLKVKAGSGFVLAALEGIRYRHNEIYLEPGDAIYLYTDGVTEANNAANEFYGEDRLLEYLNEHKKESVREILTGLRNDIDAFVAEEEQFDDITMLMLSYQRNRKEETSMIEREFDAELDQLMAVSQFVEEELEKLACPMKTMMQIQVALEEIFVNIAHYAYGEEHGKVLIGISSQEEGMVSIRFVDKGLPFDPLAKNDPDITLSAEERKVGGLGIFMVKKSMDDVNYKYTNGQNILTITKKL